MFALLKKEFVGFVVMTIKKNYDVDLQAQRTELFTWLSAL